MQKYFKIFACVFFLLTGCGQSKQYQYVSLESANGSGPSSKQEQYEDPFRVAVASITSARENIIYYEELLAYLEEKLGRPIHLVQRKTYAEVNDLLRAGTVDLGFICTYSYVLGRQEFGLEILVAPVINGKMEYYSYIIVHRDSGINTFEELRGKDFAFTDPISNSGRLYPVFALSKLGETPESFFRAHIFTYSHDNSVRAVASRLTDGAAVDSLVFYYMADREPEAFENLVVIHKSPTFGIQPVVVRPGLSEDFKEELREFFLTLHEKERGREILSGLKFEKFQLQEDSAYDGIREMADALRNNRVQQ
jgi:phosphonate transport system substrate-binding protein